MYMSEIDILRFDYGLQPCLYVCRVVVFLLVEFFIQWGIEPLNYRIVAGLLRCVSPSPQRAGIMASTLSSSAEQPAVTREGLEILSSTYLAPTLSAHRTDLWPLFAIERGSGPRLQPAHPRLRIPASWHPALLDLTDGVQSWEAALRSESWVCFPLKCVCLCQIVCGYRKKGKNQQGS